MREPVPPPPATFDEVLDARRSARRLVPASIRELANLVLYAHAPRMFTRSKPLLRTRRPTASAGGLHPVEPVLVTVRARARAFHVDTIRRELRPLRVINASELRSLVSKVRHMVPQGRADLLVLVGDLDLTAAAYENETSLVWRDAGAFMQTLHLCATALRLGFCPLGITGGEVVLAIGMNPHRFIGTGMALVGRSDSAPALMRG